MALDAEGAKAQRLLTQRRREREERRGLGVLFSAPSAFAALK